MSCKTYSFYGTAGIAPCSFHDRSPYCARDALLPSGTFLSRARNNQTKHRVARLLLVSEFWMCDCSETLSKFLHFFPNGPQVVSKRGLVGCRGPPGEHPIKGHGDQKGTKLAPPEYFIFILVREPGYDGFPTHWITSCLFREHIVTRKSCRAYLSRPRHVRNRCVRC